MAVRFRCPCGKRLKAPEDYVGKKARCPVCERLLKVPGEQAEPPDTEETPPKGEETRATVVLADSTDRDREVAKRIFEDHGYRVYAATDGEQAIALIRQHKPDVAVVDLKTQKLSGFQVIRTITDQFNAENRDVWQTPFIMTCTKVTGRDRQYAISLGVDHYYAKPLAPATICARIEKILGHVPSGIRRR